MLETLLSITQLPSFLFTICILEVYSDHFVYHDRNFKPTFVKIARKFRSEIKEFKTLKMTIQKQLIGIFRKLWPAKNR